MSRPAATALLAPSLEAFLEIARLASFTKAARILQLSQPALSLRVSKLEDTLGMKIFFRRGTAISLTPAGYELLRFAQASRTLSEEALARLRGEAKNATLHGTLRLAGYFSVMRSLILPALKSFLQREPEIDVELFFKPSSELAEWLMRGQVDYIVSDIAWSHAGVEEIHLGAEDYVVIESPRGTDFPDRYLDNDPSDRSTEIFFRLQKKRPPSFRRAYFGDVYGIMDGVEAGLGRAVVPRHLLKGNQKRFRIVPEFKNQPFDFYLYFFQQSNPSHLHQRLVTELKERVIRQLAPE